LKEWNVIHKIKALHDSGDGLSRRQIALKLKISRNTVRKYLAMDEPQIAAQLEDCERHKLLDEYIVYIKHQLQNAPGLSAVKLKRRLVKKFDDVNVL
jgi:predicted transcriptional regulator